MEMQQLQENFASKVQRGIFQPVARHLTKYQDPDNRFADAVAQTWETFQRCAVEQDKVLSDGALVQHCTWRATDLGRYFVRGYSLRNQDAMSEEAFRGGRVRVLHMEGQPSETEPDGHQPIELGFAQARCPSPERNIVSAIDLQRWLADLSEQDREILAARMAGEDLGVIASIMGASQPTACRRLQYLGHQLAERCGVKIAKQQRGRPRKQRAA